MHVAEKPHIVRFLGSHEQLLGKPVGFSTLTGTGSSFYVPVATSDIMHELTVSVMPI